MKATAVIVNYFTSHLLPPLLEELNSDPLITRILVADNSGEPGLGKIAERYAKVDLLPFSGNVGFSAAVNRAAEGVETDWLLLINPDTLPDGDCVEKLISGAEKCGALIAGPRFYWDDEKKFRLPPAPGYSLWIQAGDEYAARFEVDAQLLDFYWNIRCNRFWKETEPFDEPFLSGACLLIRNDRSRFIDGKVFDERFFLYFEDTDLCIRALIDDFRVMCIPDAICVHYWDQSPREEKPERMAVSAARFLEKHYPVPIAGIAAPVIQYTGFEDLGVLKATPRLTIENTQKIGNHRDLELEIALNPRFIPSIRSDMDSSFFVLPEVLWERLSPGTFYARVRDIRRNQNLKQWTWRKA